jgi:hypothetical protein
MSDYFQAAYDRARAQFTDDQWLALEPRRITQLIYEEMRRLDAEIAAAARVAEAELPQVC